MNYFNKLHKLNFDVGLLLLRVSIALLMMVHGWQKVANYSQLVDVFPDPLGMGSQATLTIGAIVELGGSLLILMGLFTPLALIPLIMTMLTAAFIAHGGDPWSAKELPILYLAVYATLFMTGPGRYSIDHKLFGDKE